MEANQQAATTDFPDSPANIQSQRNFVIPGCSVVVHCENEDGMPVQDLLSIVFGLASSNPDAKVDFWIKVSHS